MEVWAVAFDTLKVEELDDVYHQALLLMDPESRERIERFYHQVDRFRGLVGRLLIRTLLKQKGVSPNSMTFGVTANRKPYITTPLDQPIGYNITHDNGIVAMAFASGDALYPDPPAYRVGVDVMLLKLPRRMSLPSFVETVSDQLTAHEQQLLLSQAPLDQREAIRRFYLIWTLKEAYTKALGLGLGFNFRRIEYDVPNDVVRIDGVAPVEWEFVRFDIDRNGEQYVGVVARYAGDRAPVGGACVVEARPPGDWLKVFDASEFVVRAVQELN